jgi:hypothetical protein
MSLIRQMLISTVGVLSLTLLVAVGRGEARERPDAENLGMLDSQSASQGRTGGQADDTVTVTGCLTAGPSAKSLVLTAEADPVNTTTARTAGTMPTFTYTLIGGENLQQHIGRQVSVTGRLDKKKDRVELESKNVDEQPRSDRPDQTTRVDSKQKVDVRIQQLHVISVAPVGQPCDTTAR